MTKSDELHFSKLDANSKERRDTPGFNTLSVEEGLKDVAKKNENEI